MKRTCVFISSSDNTADVLLQTLKSYNKYWHTSKFDRFVGLNTQQNKLDESFKNLSIKPIYTKNITGWSSELKEQLEQLKEKYDFVLLVLDDFFIKDKINEKKIDEVLLKFQSENVDYLRLIPKKGSILFSLYQRLINKFSHKVISKLYKYSPYYSSLQIAIWRIDYFINCLDNCSNIWQFEHQVPKKTKHYCVNKKVISYGHIVEKGKWFSFVPELFKSHRLVFEKNDRKMYSKVTKNNIFKVYKFRILGYSFMVIKNIIKKL